MPIGRNTGLRAVDDGGQNENDTYIALSKEFSLKEGPCGRKG